MFQQVASAEPSPCKTFLFVFLKVAQKFGQIEKFSPMKPTVPVCLGWSCVPWFCWGALLRAVIGSVTTGVKGHNFLGAESLWWPGPSPAGIQWCPAPPFEIGSPPFQIWPTGCCIHPILHFKMCPPPSGFRPLLLFFTPPVAKSWWRAWWWRRKVLTTAQVLQCFRKTSGSSMEALNLLLAPGAIWARYAPTLLRCQCIWSEELHN